MNLKTSLVCISLLLTNTLMGQQLFIDKANMDLSVKPGDNFYEYANGTWLKNTKIPASETRWGSFNELIEKTDQKLLLLLEENSKKENLVKGSASQQIKDFYLSGMDSVAINQKGYEPIKDDLKRISKIKKNSDIIDEIVWRTNEGKGLLFGVYASPDAKQSDKVVPYLVNGGLGLPDRDYYLKDDERSVDIRNKYIIHITNQLKNIGVKEKKASQMASQILNLEIEMAKATMSRVDLRDPNKRYNKLTLSQFSKTTPMLNWEAIVPNMGVNGYDSIIVIQPKFFESLGVLLKDTDLDIWKSYLTWHIVRGAANSLSDDFVNESFSFYGNFLQGQKEIKPRWKRVLTVIDSELDSPLGQIYTEKYFNSEAKTKMINMIENIKTTFSERIDRLEWMDNNTKVLAKAKLDSITQKIGYPDKWKDMSSINIVSDNYLQNIESCAKFYRQDNLNKLGKPVDKTEWGMSAPTVNAYYSPIMNEIVFPAGILQFPFFDFNADDAINYGGIGAVIGHELTHGFDDQGCKYDANGNLNNWQSEKDKERFTALAENIEKQYDAYTVNDGKLNVNGKLTLGENIADLGGASIAYEAFVKTLKGKDKTTIDGFTPEQRFFLSWAQVWRSKITEEAQAQRILTDNHSPGEYRCNGPLSNMTEFYDAFDVKEGDKMWKPENNRTKIW